MSYQEKRSLLNLIAGVLIPGVYFWIILSGDPLSGLNTDELLYFWAKSILWLIPITIAIHIVGAIVFGIGNAIITREKPPATDERDKLIELKSMRNSRYMFGFGCVMGLVALVMGMSVNVWFALFIVSSALSQVIESVSQLYFYRNGI